MRKSVTTTEYLVYSGSGHNGPQKFKRYGEALGAAISAAAVPSYIHPQNRGHSQLVTRTITEEIEDIW